jgi:hypothetical protein
VNATHTYVDTILCKIFLGHTDHHLSISLTFTPSDTGLVPCYSQPCVTGKHHTCDLVGLLTFKPSLISYVYDYHILLRSLMWPFVISAPTDLLITFDPRLLPLVDHQLISAVKHPFVHLTMHSAQGTRHSRLPFHRQFSLSPRILTHTTTRPAPRPLRPQTSITKRGARSHPIYLIDIRSYPTRPAIPPYPIYKERAREGKAYNLWKTRAWYGDST